MKAFIDRFEEKVHEFRGGLVLEREHSSLLRDSLVLHPPHTWHECAVSFVHGSFQNVLLHLIKQWELFSIDFVEVEVIWERLRGNVFIDVLVQVLVEHR